MAERRTLILVDFDNVVHDLRAATDLLPSASPSSDGTWLLGGEGIAVPTTVSETPTCVVAFVLNTESACEAGDGIGTHLALVARHLGHFVARAPSVGVELGLTLNAPQSADALLVRLLAKSPRAGHEGPFHEVCLLSGDLGLSDAIEAVLEGWQRVGGSHGCPRWTAGVPITRRAPADPRRPRCAAASVDDTRRGILVGDEALALWAAHQQIDVPADEGLASIARQCRDAAGLLSQVGPTLASVRGMERLTGALFRRVLDVGACDRNDGLELRPVIAPPDTYLAGVASRLGPGALRIEEVSSTARCRLPTAIARMATRVVVRNPGEIDIGATLKYTQADVLAPDHDTVDFVARGKDLVVKVVSRSGEAPARWWVRGTSAKADPRQPGLGFMARAGGVKAASAYAAVQLRGATREVVLRAPPPAFPVHVAAKIDGEQLGLGEAGGHVFAVLAPNAGLAAGDHECEPIQDVDRSAFVSKHPRLRDRFDDLSTLPIVVPRSIP